MGSPAGHRQVHGIEHDEGEAAHKARIRDQQARREDVEEHQERMHRM